MIGVIAQILVLVTGDFYPLIAPLIGALGTFVTGSDTSANVLFGGLQVEAANAIGMSPYWLAAANTAGATARKDDLTPKYRRGHRRRRHHRQRGQDSPGHILKVCAIYVIIIGLVVYFGAPLVERAVEYLWIIRNVITVVRDTVPTNCLSVVCAQFVQLHLLI